MYEKKCDSNFALSLNGVKYRVIASFEDKKNVAEFLKDYFAEEKLNLPASTPLEKLTPPYIEQGVSILAEEEASGKLLGVALTCIVNRGDDLDKYSLDDDLKDLPEALAMFDHGLITAHIKTLKEVFAQQGDSVNQAVVLDVVRVRPEFRRKKIGSELVKRCLEVAKNDAKCGYAVSHATNAVVAEAIMAKDGWEKSGSTDWEDVKLKGKRYFPEGTLNASRVIGYKKKL